MLAILKRIGQFFNRIYETTKYFLTSQYANLLLTISVALMITSLVVLLMIIFDPFRLSFDIQDAAFSNYQGLSLHGEFERIADLYNIYTSLQAFNVFFLILRVLLIFGFSGELSVVLDLISDALLDFVFFILMFFLVRTSLFFPLRGSSF